MQDEVNEKTVSLCINGGIISARILKNAMAKALARYCGLSWETEYGEADEAELPVIEY